MVDHTNHWESLRHIHRLYRRHIAFHLIEFIFIAFLSLILGFQVLYLAVEVFSLGDVGINVFATGLVVVIVFIWIRYLQHWYGKGIRISTFFHRWEESQPDVANRSSLLVYTEKQPDEIGRLGYSEELLHAEDHWLSHFIRERLEKTSLRGPLIAFTTFAAIALASLFFLWNHSERVIQGGQKIAQALLVRGVTEEAPHLRVPEELQVERGKPATLTATSDRLLGEGDVYIHINQPSGWKTISADGSRDTLTFQIPAIHRAFNYYFSVENILSNQGEVVPLDPPSLVEGQIAITLPEYTNRPPETVSTLRPLSVLYGSEVVVNATASTPLDTAHLVVNGVTQEAKVNGRNLKASWVAEESGDFSFRLRDQYDLSASSRKYRVTTVEDATPTVDIMYPEEEVSDIPEMMKQKVQARFRDDYAIHRIYFYSEINDNEDTRKEEFIWAYTPETAEEVGAATEFYLSREWDLEPMELFPGDQVTFYMEAWDEDHLNGPKKGRSKTYTVRYPSLTDLLDQWQASEEKQVEQLSDTVQKQKDITHDVEETIEDIERKKDRSSSEEDDEDSLWMERQKMESLKERQEELVQEARKIEEELKKYEESAQQELSEEEKEKQGFTSETVEKIQKIQQLYQELLDEDSKRMMQQFEQTLEQMNQEITKEQLQDLDFSVKDFNSQLDRTLSMLENTYKSRQFEGLREMSTELAERQDHLQRETEQLQQEKEALERERQEVQEEFENTQEEAEKNPSEELEEKLDELEKKLEDLQAEKESLQEEESIMAERQDTLNKDTGNMMEQMERMRENLEESNPQISQQLQEMIEQSQQQGLQEEMEQAEQNLRQEQTQQARQHQQNAQQQLQQMSEQMQQDSMNMGGMELEMDTVAMRRLMDQGLYLSQQMEELTESPQGQSQASIALRKAKVFSREIQRVYDRWNELAQENPFLNREVERKLRTSDSLLRRAVEAGKGVKWVGLHETRQSLMTLNDAIYQMLQDLQTMQQQMNSSESMQEQMQQMISQQQNLQQMLQELREMGEEGEEMIEQLKQMAQRQQQIREQIEEMMRQYRHQRQLKNQLQGIYDEMRDVEDLLEEGENDEEVDEKQQRILTRMLEAGTSQEKDEYGKERKEEVAETGTEGSQPEDDVSLSSKEKVRQAVERPPEESIPYPFREAIKQYYIRLSEQVTE